MHVTLFYFTKRNIYEGFVNFIWFSSTSLTNWNLWYSSVWGTIRILYFTLVLFVYQTLKLFVPPFIYILGLWRALKLYFESSLLFLWSNTTITFIFFVSSTIPIESCNHCHLTSLLWSYFKTVVIKPRLLLLQFLLILSPFGSNFYTIYNIFLRCNLVSFIIHVLQSSDFLKKYFNSILFYNLHFT